MSDLRPAPRPSGRALEGRFYALRPIDPTADAGPLHSASHRGPQDHDIWRYMSAGPFASADEMRSWLESLASNPAHVAYTVVERASGDPVGGCVFLNIVPSNRCLEVGSIWYVPAHQRSKANTEVAYLLLREAFDELGYRRAEWKCNALNERSRRAALRLGFQYEGLFRQHMIVKGTNRDTAWFAIIDSEWPDVRRRLEAWLYDAPTDDRGRVSLSGRTEVLVAIETPRQEEVERLVAELDAYQSALYPPGSNHLLGVDQLAAPEVRLFVARREGRAVGCAALRVDATGYGEVKRMFVVPAARGMKIGRQLLAAIETEARLVGLTRLRLETGIHQPEALGLYRVSGFIRRGPFGDHGADPLSAFMEKEL